MNDDGVVKWVPFVSRGSMYGIRAESYWTKDWAIGLCWEEERDVAVNNKMGGQLIKQVSGG